MLQNDKPLSQLPFQIPKLILDKLDVLFIKKGQVIFSEGSTPLGAYYLKTGKVKISKTGNQRKEQIIRIVTQNELLSHTDLFTNSRYSTLATALEDSFLLFISKQEFWNLLRENNHLFEQLLQQISLDVKNIEAKIVDLAYKPVRGRLANAILDLDKIFSEDTGQHNVFITRTDLASYVGTVKETVNRLLSEFRNERLIATNGTRITILDVHGLNRICKMYI